MKHEELIEELKYNHDTGLFSWRKTKGRKHLGKTAGHLSEKNCYVCIGFKNKKYYAHRLAWFYVYREWPKDEIDHINGIMSDNRFVNLRDVNSRTNKENRHNSRGTLGVYTNKQGKKNPYRSSICVNRKQMHLGVFKTKEEASQVYLKAKRKLHHGYTI